MIKRIQSINKSPIAEFLAVFAFMFIGVGAVGAAQAAQVQFGAALVWIALAHGVGIAGGIMVFGRVSGGHINPAVTFAALISGKIGWVQAVRYISAQVLGAILAILVLRGLAFDSIEDLGIHALGPGINIAEGIGIEIVLTFILVFTIFAVAMDKRGSPIHAPFAIGLVVMAEHFVAVPLTGASMNPARSFGPALVNGLWSDHWVYWLGPLIGATLAAVVYTYLFGEKEDVEQMWKLKS